MSAENRPWTQQEISSAKERIYAVEDDFRSDYDHCIHLQCEATELCRCLEELVAQVRGECPSLLNEDSGGDAVLSLRIDAALSATLPK